MQPVAHIVAYYEYKLLAEYLIHAPNIPTSNGELREKINRYEIFAEDRTYRITTTLH